MDKRDKTRGRGENRIYKNVITIKDTEVVKGETHGRGWVRYDIISKGDERYSTFTKPRRFDMLKENMSVRVTYRVTREGFKNITRDGVVLLNEYKKLTSFNRSSNTAANAVGNGLDGDGP